MQAFSTLNLFRKTLGESVVNPINKLSLVDTLVLATGGFSILSFFKNESQNKRNGNFAAWG